MSLRRPQDCEENDDRDEGSHRSPPAKRPRGSCCGDVHDSDKQMELLEEMRSMLQKQNEKLESMSRENQDLREKVSCLTADISRLDGYLQQSPAPRVLSDQHCGLPLQLKFLNSCKNDKYSTRKIEADDETPIKVAICGHNNKIITCEPFSSMRVQIVPIHGDFDNDHKGQWTEEYFRSKIVTGRPGKEHLLSKDLYIRLQDGVGYLDSAKFQDNSSFVPSKRFKLGVMAADERISQRIQEGITESFAVKDVRGYSTKKNLYPSPCDAVYKLSRIAMNGDRHKLLEQNGIKTVEDLLSFYKRNPEDLRKILGKISDQEWDRIINHAHKCNQRLGIYSSCIQERNVSHEHETYSRSDGSRYLQGSCSMQPSPTPQKQLDVQVTHQQSSSTYNELSSGASLEGISRELEGIQVAEEQVSGVGNDILPVSSMDNNTLEGSSSQQRRSSECNTMLDGNALPHVNPSVERMRVFLLSDQDLPWEYLLGEDSGWGGSCSASEQIAGHSPASEAGSISYRGVSPVSEPGSRSHWELPPSPFRGADSRSSRRLSYSPARGARGRSCRRLSPPPVRGAGSRGSSRLSISPARGARGRTSTLTETCRKTLADSRPRVKGRFARNGEAEAEADERKVSSNSYEYCCGHNDLGHGSSCYDGQYKLEDAVGEWGWRAPGATATATADEAQEVCEPLSLGSGDVAVSAFNGGSDNGECGWQASGTTVTATADEAQEVREPLSLGSGDAAISAFNGGSNNGEWGWRAPGATATALTDKAQEVRELLSLGSGDAFVSAFNGGSDNGEWGWRALDATAMATADKAQEVRELLNLGSAAAAVSAFNDGSNNGEWGRRAPGATATAMADEVQEVRELLSLGGSGAVSAFNGGNNNGKWGWQAPGATATATADEAQEVRELLSLRSGVAVVSAFNGGSDNGECGWRAPGTTATTTADEAQEVRELLSLGSGAAAVSAFNGGSDNGECGCRVPGATATTTDDEAQEVRKLLSLANGAATVSAFNGGSDNSEWGWRALGATASATANEAQEVRELLSLGSGDAAVSAFNGGSSNGEGGWWAPGATATAMADKALEVREPWLLSLSSDSGDPFSLDSDSGDPFSLGAWLPTNLGSTFNGANECCDLDDIPTNRAS